VIDELQLWLWHSLVEWLAQKVIFEAWQEFALVLISLHESMSRIAIGLH
jgi:hypothetical protein